jgi:two-component system, sensor histidine kinase PdtaS
VGAAVVKIPMDVMSAVWRSLELGPSSTVGLLREDGWQVARHPPVETLSNLSGYILFTDYLKKSPHGVYDAVSPVDGQERIVGYRKVPDAPPVVIASISRTLAMTRLSEQMRVSLAAAVDRNNLLMREIHHRTKNNLQSVASLLKLQPISEEAKAAMTARIAAMSALHEQAYRSDQYSDVDLRDYLLTLVDTIRKTSAEGIRFATELAEVAIDRDLA